MVISCLCSCTAGTAVVGWNSAVTVYRSVDKGEAQCFWEPKCVAVAGKTRNEKPSKPEKIHQVIKRAVLKHEMVTWQFSELHRSHTNVAPVSNLLRTPATFLTSTLCCWSLRMQTVWQTGAALGRYATTYTNAAFVRIIRKKLTVPKIVKKVLRISWNSEVHYREQKSPLFLSFVSQMNPFHVVSSDLFSSCCLMEGKSNLIS